MTDNAAENLLRQMGIDPDKMEEHVEEERKKPSERSICLCGHPKARHYLDEEFSTCKPTKMQCTCAKFIPVAKVEDTRDFLHKTKGHGWDHALTKGLLSSAQKNRYVEWIPQNYVCALCKESGEKTALTIYPFEGSPETGLRKTIHLEFARWNFFLCEDCLEKK